MCMFSLPPIPATASQDPQADERAAEECESRRFGNTTTRAGGIIDPPAARPAIGGKPGAGGVGGKRHMAGHGRARFIIQKQVGLAHRGRRRKLERERRMRSGESRTIVEPEAKASNPST